MSPSLLTHADAGDAVSRAIVLDGGRILGEQARVAADRVGLLVEGATVVLTGGVFEHVSDLLATATMDHLNGGIAVRQRTAPVSGALLLAFDLAGRKISSDTLSKSILLNLERLQ
jgi:hypothetical protein